MTYSPTRPSVPPATGYGLTWHTTMRIVLSMGLTIKINGQIDRQAPDPSAPNDPTRTFLGMLTASWNYDGPRSSMAAIVKIATGGGLPIDGWGTTMLCLRWVGDPPMPEVAQAVYDAIRDRGPAFGSIAITLEATARSTELGSYRRAG